MPFRQRIMTAYTPGALDHRTCTVLGVVGLPFSGRGPLRADALQSFFDYGYSRRIRLAPSPAS